MLKELNNFSVDARFPKVISSLPTLSDMTLVCQLSLSLSLRSNPIINNLTIVLEKNNLIYLIATAIKKVSVKQFIKPFPIFSRFSMRSRMVIGISLVSLEISFHPHFFPPIQLSSPVSRCCSSSPFFLWQEGTRPRVILTRKSGLKLAPLPSRRLLVRRTSEGNALCDRPCNWKNDRGGSPVSLGYSSLVHGYSICPVKSVDIEKYPPWSWIFFAEIGKKYPAISKFGRRAFY